MLLIVSRILPLEGDACKYGVDMNTQQQPPTKAMSLPLQLADGRFALR